MTLSPTSFTFDATIFRPINQHRELRAAATQMWNEIAFPQAA
jgi:hypothetical protein